MKLSSTSLASAILFTSITACGNDEPATPDSGVAADAAEVPDGGSIQLPDASRPDAQPRPDATTRDAAVECVTNGSMSVDGTSVMVGNTTTRPTNRAGENAVLSCRGNRPSLMIGAPVRFQGCVDFIGDRGTPAELAELQIAVFYAVDSNTGMPVDPTYDPATGADRAPLMRLSPDVSITTDASACPRGARLVLGRDSLGADALRTDIEYIVRTRSATVTRGAEPVWVDQYHFGVTVRSDALEAGGGALERCTPQMCSGRVDLVLARRHALHIIGGQAGAAIEGFADLSDHVGSGHLMIQSLDCANQPMSSVVSGFSPVPPARGYLTSGFAYSAGATATSSTAGIYLGLGFTGTTTVTPRVVTTGSALSSDGTCAEPYAGRTVPVYPDALSLVRLGRENVLVP